MPRVKQRDDKLIFHKAPPLLGVFGGLFFLVGMGFQVFILVTAFTGKGMRVNGVMVYEINDLIFPMLFPIIFWGIGLTFLLYSLLARYEIDEDGISSISPLGRLERRIRWSDAISFEKTRPKYDRGKPVVAGPDGMIFLGTGTHLLPVLCQQIGQRLPSTTPVVSELKSNRTAPPNPLPIEERTFRLGGILRTIFGAIWTFGVLSIGLGLITQEAGKGEGVLPVLIPFAMLIPFLTVGFWLVTSGTVQRIVVDESGLVYYNNFGREAERFYWSEIDGYAWLSSNKGVGYYMLWADTRYISFDSQMAGFRHFKNILDQRVHCWELSTR